MTEEESYQRRLKGIAKNHKEHTTVFSIRFHNEYDKRYIKFLKEIPNRSQFIREAIDQIVED